MCEFKILLAYIQFRKYYANSRVFNSNVEELSAVQSPDYLLFGSVSGKEMQINQKLGIHRKRLKTGTSRQNNFKCTVNLRCKEQQKAFLNRILEILSKSDVEEANGRKALEV